MYVVVHQVWESHMFRIRAVYGPFTDTAAARLFWLKNSNNGKDDYWIIVPLKDPIL